MNPSLPWRRLPIALLITIILYTGYQITNRWHATNPVFLPLNAVDRAIPFWLWTVWPYFGILFCLFLPVFLIHDVRFQRTMAAMIFAVCLNLTIWSLWPTAYERPLVPHGEGWTLAAYHWLCQVDTPANCFPSGHITTPAIAVWAFVQERPRQKLLWLAGFCLLATSILTIKQHYVVDLFGGFASASFGWWVAGRFYRFIPV